MKKFAKFSALSYVFIFVALFVGSQIYISTGPTKELLDKKDEDGNWYAEWSETGPEVIPKNLKEAFTDILTELPESEIENYRSYLQTLPDEWDGFDKFRYEMRKILDDEGDEIPDLQFGSGTRAAWGLWHGSRLARWMIWHGSYSHPDDMTISIRESFDDYIEHGIEPYRRKERIVMLLILTTVLLVPVILVYLLIKLIKYWSNKAPQTTSASARV